MKVEMNIRVTKLYQGSDHSALELAFNSAPEGKLLLRDVSGATGLTFSRPPGNLLALRELHIAEIGDDVRLDEAYARAVDAASTFGDVQDSQKNMKGPGEVTPNELGKALNHKPSLMPGSDVGR